MSKKTLLIDAETHELLESAEETIVAFNAVEPEEYHLSLQDELDLREDLLSGGFLEEVYIH